MERPLRVVKFDELEELRGVELGASAWHAVDQQRIDRFAECTEDRQWIHVDQKRAAEGPFGSAIAHGYLTLALIPMLVREIWRLEGSAAGVNYGLNRVRFIEPVRSGARIRARAAIKEVERPDPDVCAVTTDVLVELSGCERPAAAAETISRFVRHCGFQSR